MEQELKKLVPYGRSSSGRGLWSPNTSVVKPKEILKRLELILRNRGVNFLLGWEINKINETNNLLNLLNKSSKNNNLISYHYGHLFNCAGLQADRIAHSFKLGKNLSLLPFKGIYWQLHPKAPFTFNTNFYPVPDLNIPFLGIHITPRLNASPLIGPNALPVFQKDIQGYDLGDVKEIPKILTNNSQVKKA